MTYLPYAGIGSRETPKLIQDTMTRIGGYLFSQGWTLRSGGAEGADKAFESGFDNQANNTLINGQHDYPGKEIFLPWKNFNFSSSNLHPGAYPFTKEELETASKFHPAWHRCSPGAQAMHTRNVRQIQGLTPPNPPVTLSKFIVCWTEGGKLKGGTAQALRIAMALDIPVFNLGIAENQSHLNDILLQIDSIQMLIKSKETANALI